ncbi:MAG: response regulator [Acidobacteriaceae bacterium]|nr:response regulator [Acidobacteriaceae bacterium]
MSTTPAIRQNIGLLRSPLDLFLRTWHRRQLSWSARLLRYAFALATLAVPAAVSFILQSHASLGPVISVSYVIAVCAAAWWGGAFSGILVSCATVPVVTMVATHGKIIVPPHLDPVGLVVLFFIAVLVSRVATSRKRVEEMLRTNNEELEKKVQARTADLSKTAASLELEVLKHEKTEQQLRLSEQRYRLLFEDSPLAMAVFDAETLEFLAANGTAEELFGYKRQELLRMKLPDTWPPKEIPDMEGIVSAIQTTTAFTDVVPALQKGGKLLNVEMRMRCIDFDGRRAQMALLTDITEQKRLEFMLRQSQKMEAIGSLAGGIAHDFNNLLTVILGYSDSILHKLGKSDPLRDKVSEIQAAGKRAANLTSQLLAFSRKQILKPQVLDLNDVVSNISRMLGRLVGEDIQISLHLAASLGRIQADPTQLEQVLVNLAVNARDAMPSGGQLVIETQNTDLDDHAATLHGVPPGQYAVLIVTDTGCGMSEETKARVFEPFFTTKEVGKGTGLGLSMVFGVVKQSGGTVTIYSELGVGTSFKIYLPRLDAPVAQTDEVQEIHSLSAAVNGATILLVEDEPSLRALAREVLKEAGYRVVEASNGKDALRISQELETEPGLLLTDVVMPEMSGLQLAEELRRKWPSLAVLYTSGYTDHALLQRNVLRQDMPFLQKPYMPGSLLEQVGNVLASSAEPHALVPA